MTYLKCSATTCVYNKDELCSKGNIRIMGNDAVHASDTCCESFRERTDCSASNSCMEGAGKKEIQIDCQACQCCYNQACKCTAGTIDISGQGAKDCCDTKCATFLHK